MVNLITQNINGNPINSSLVKQNIEENQLSLQRIVFKPKKAEDKQHKHKLFVTLRINWRRGLLIYYGFKKPNAVKFIKNMLSDRVIKMEQQVADFYSTSKKRACKRGICRCAIKN